MKLTLRANVAGELRLVTSAETTKPRPRIPLSDVLLVRDEVLQDSISVGHAHQRAGYGGAPLGRKFSRLAKGRLKEFGALADRVERQRSVFLTGTVPASTDQAYQALSRYSAWLVSRLSQWLRDRYPGAMFFGVWEYQKRGALHMHLIATCIDQKQARQLKFEWKKRWIALLDGVGKRSSVDMFERASGGSWSIARWITRTDAQTVEKSATRYLAKYLSKTSAVVAGSVAYPPSTWWFASRAFRDGANAGRFSICISRLNLSDSGSLFEHIGSILTAYAEKAYPIFNGWDHRYRGVIALMEPIKAACVFRDVKNMLAPWQYDEESRCGDDKVQLSELTRSLDGVLLTST